MTRRRLWCRTGNGKRNCLSLRATHAWRQARLALGGPEQVKENCRDARGTRWLDVGCMFFIRGEER
jgi:hypothetical protein